jgi:4-nitrophenyl phosphatase
MTKINWKKIKGFIFDLDGVVYRGNKPIKSAVKTINHLIKKKYKVAFLTNNSTKSQKEFSQKIIKCGVKIEPKFVITTSVATANFISKKYKKGNNIYVIGSKALKNEIKLKKFRISDNNVKAVVAGLDLDINYKKITHASNILRKGKLLVATNPDKILPNEKGFQPGAGSIIQSIIEATGPKIKKIFIGKPNTFLIKEALKVMRLNRDNVVLVGDQLETDILAAKNYKMKSILVETGVPNNTKKIKASLKLKNLGHLIIK